jgi:transcriptional repressor NrdR
MKCPYCHCKDTKVLDKRETSNYEATRRRRECLKCNRRFTTYERIETSNVLIVKKDGRREQFDRQKLKSGLLKACEKRPISAEKIEKVIDEIEAKLLSYKSPEIKSEVLGELVMRKLKTLDKVAYIRFASVYRSFEDLTSFQDELKLLLKKKQK